MNPTVLIAMWGRKRMIEANIRLLSEQKCQIVVVASIQEDFDFLRSLQVPHLQIVPAPNNPLGRKWQSGVDQCRILGSNPLIICGSDDFLSQNFIEKACFMAKNHDFVFFDHWFIHEPATGKDYHLQYNMMKFQKPPLGSGRIFGQNFLEKQHWQLFDTGKDRLLDDFAWHAVRHEDRILMNPPDMNILAVKGAWEQMNPIENILSSETIDWKHEKEIDKHFNFPRSVKETFQGI